MVRTHLKYGSNLLLVCFYQYGRVTEFVGIANATDGILVGHTDSAKTFENILGIFDRLYWGKY